MDYRVLGRVSVHRDGESLEIGAFKQASLLACLLMNANHVVPTDQLLEALWGDDASTSRQNTLWVYISNLRGVLDPDRAARSDGTVLLTRAPGYVLQIDDEGLDALRFERLVAEGRSLAESDPAAGSLVLAEALSMWSGRPYEDFTYEPFAQTEIRRLEELRLEAVEARIDADLQRGLARELVSELETLTRQHPTHESFTAQLMLSLYRSGRQAQALRAYSILRSTLGEELGIEPSARLVALEEGIVVGDASLDVPAGAGGSPTRTGLAVRGYELRDQIGEGAFGVVYRAYQPAVGREVAIKIIRPELANSPTFIRRFEAEAQLVASLEHPHIVPLYDYWREPHAAYLVMRYMKGGSLQGIISASALDIDDGVRLTSQLADSLTAAHANGVIHRDVKPSNVLLDDDGNAYLSDFGIAVSGIAGQVVDDVLDQATLAAPYASPEQERRTPLTAASDTYSLAVVVAQALTGSDGPVEDILGFLPQTTREVIERATQRQAISRYASVAEFATALAASTGAGDVTTAEPGAAPTRNPYKGLMAFGRTDAGDFFGREDLVDRLLDRLAGAGVRSRFVALVGPSGSGKSSAVRAGLIPALLAGRIPMSETWFSVEMTPGVDPFAELADGLSTIATEDVGTMLSLTEMIRSSLPDDGSQLVLVIDQFEELFTHAADETRERFLAELADLIRRENGRTKVVATMRADFYDRPLAHRDFGDLLRHGTEVITPMRPDELERAIRGPAESVGITLDTALVGALIGDLGDRAGALPLLQYTLTELVDDEPAGAIGMETYQRIGGLTGALTLRADAIWATLSDSGQMCARQVFLSLVTLGEGARDTRRRVLLQELRQLPVQPEDLTAVIDGYATHRLLSLDRDPVTRGPTVEISHEALLTQWERLRELIDEARVDVRQQRDLARAASEWHESIRSEEFLLTPGRLALYEDWLDTSSIPIGTLAVEFMEASARKRDRTAEEDRLRAERELALERQSRRRLRGVAAALATAAVIAIGLTVFAMDREREADAERVRAEQAERDAIDGERNAQTLRLVAEERLDQLEAASLPGAALGLLREDPGLSVYLAGEAIVKAYEADVDIEEPVAMLHVILQDLNVRFPDDAQTHAVTSTRAGFRAIFDLSVAEVLEIRDSALAHLWADRAAIERDELCLSHLNRSCPVESVAARLPTEVLTNVGVNPTFGQPLLENTQIRLLWDSPDLRNHDRGVIFETEARVFERAFGVDIRSYDLVDATTADQSTILEVPHMFTHPWGYASDLVGAIPVDGILDEDQVRANSPESMNQLLVADGRRWGVWTSFDVKTVVWHRRDIFDDLGLAAPSTWSELVAATDAIADAGFVPWCVGLQGDGATQSVMWMVQSQILEIGGVELFDRWVRHEIPANHPDIVEAHRRVATLLFDDRFNGGDEVVALRGGRAQGLLLGDDPVCAMWTAPLSWLVVAQRGTMPSPAVVGAFPLPAGPPGNHPVVVNGSVVSMISDRPETRIWMRSMVGPVFGTETAARASDPEFVANMRLSASSYSDDNARRIASTLQEAGRNDLIRLEVFAQIPRLYWTYQGLLSDWFSGGADATSAILAQVEAEWSQFDG